MKHYHSVWRLLDQYFNEAPSGFPQNLSLSHLTSSGVDISWNQLILEERNGIITGYVLLLTNQKIGSEVYLNSTTNFISISMLSPFTAYTVIIAAATEIGAGSYSSQLDFSTDEDGMVHNMQTQVKLH